MQWGGRTHFLLAVVRRIVEVQELPAVFVTFTAWSMIDAIRYPHYALNIIGSCPSWVVYIRYTAFIVLYPIGFLGELSLMWQSLPFVKMNHLYANFFAALPFSYYNFLWVVILSYPFLWLNLYLYMLKQRRSKLGNQNITEKKKLI
ncbi:unnamed protein product [Linum tenue]|uniref:Very-long-chain (3R)-3-hydroxyacyl-CoA dehydratase n=1 Tax=Linum tenue TaxID=586396 RepID=A0AAV0MZN9_9ROSI|nr:unnamed protein product [Linum tenue]